jgi:hypothetical protein
MSHWELPELAAAVLIITFLITGATLFFGAVWAKLIGLFRV